MVKYFILIAALLSMSIYCSSKVLELNENFLQVARDGYWLVMFYAPWCGHCKSLEPTWLKVGSILDEQQSDIKVARLDATKYTSLASIYKIKGFPTIKFFKAGLPVDYNGERSTESIIDFANRAKRPAISHITHVNMFFNARQTQNVFFLFVGDKSSTLSKKYVQTANILFTRMSFFTIERDILPNDVETRSKNTILVFKDEKYYEIPDWHESNIASWVMSEQYPTYNQLTPISFHQLRNLRKRFAIAVLKRNDPFNNTVKEIAYKRSHPYVFCWIEGNELVNNIVYGSVSVPDLVVYDDNTKDYFVMKDKEKPLSLTKSNVEHFFQRIDNNEQPALGGSAIKEQAKRLMGSVTGFVFDLFANSPIIAILILLVPSFLIVVCCICCCTMSDDDNMSNYEDEEDSETDYDEYATRTSDDVETEIAGNITNDPDEINEGIRQRITESNQ